MADAKEMTKAPETTEDGVELAGKFPHNHRLRAEALVAAGKGKDPDGLIGDDMIEGTKARLDAEAKAEKAAEKSSDGDKSTGKDA